jgi:hypothetical protein
VPVLHVLDVAVERDVGGVHDLAHGDVPSSLVRGFR